MMLKKLLLSTMGLSIIGGSSLNAIYETTNKASLAEIKQEKLQFIKDDLLLNSTLLNSETIYKYNNQEYRNENSIIDFELQNNPILQEVVSSNPNKIIKNYATNELDETKIYNTNSDEMVLVYKNALGKTVLPNCYPNQSSGCYEPKPGEESNNAKDRALDSYVNKGLIRPKYSYDTAEWFDSVEEAKMAFKKSKYDVKSSLFYYYNGMYFNAFNKDDEKSLQNQLTQAYSYNAFNGQLVGKMNGSLLEEPMSYEKTYFDQQFENAFKNYVIDYINEIIEMKISYSFEITTGYDDQWFKDVHSYTPGINLELSNDNRTLKISVEDSARSKLNLEDILQSIKNKKRYDIVVISHGCGNADRKENGIYNYIDKNGNIIFKYTLDRDEDDACAGGYPKINPEAIKIDEKNINQEKINFKFKSNNAFFQKINELYPISNLINNSILINELINFKNNNVRELISELAMSNNIANIDYQFKNIIANHIYENLKPKLYIGGENHPIQSDWVYGSKIGSSNKITQFSYKKENQKFKDNYILSETDYKDEDILSINLNSGLFKTEYKYWRDNFYYLENDEYNNGVPLRFMYYVDNKETNKITQFSNIYGDLITTNYQKAKDIAFDNELAILKKAYEVYDINGKKYFTRESENNIVNDLKKQVVLDYKYIHKDEANTLKDQDKSFENLITDGRYTVYKFKAANGKTMYFKDYKSALEIYKNQVALIGGVVQETRYSKLYSLIVENQLKTYEWNDKTDLNQLSKIIYEDIYY